MSEGLLSGKKGVVMGVANEKSIAWACAQACAAQGATLAFNYLGEALERRVRKLAADIPGSVCFPCDVTKDSEITEFFEHIKSEFGTVDFVIHSLAFAQREDLTGKFIDTKRENFLLAINISAYSLVAVAREAAPLMNSGGSIISMTYYGAEKVIPHYNVMGVAKATLEASARYLAEDLGPKGIRVNCVSAGPLRTLSSSAIAGMKLMLNTNEKNAPLRRNVTPEEVGKTSVYLLSDLASGVTGEVLHVDCGYNILGMYGADILSQEKQGE
ncbi:MAG: enoyl-ACP reductase [Candidatus Hydrogenedentes bacterium]|nr:enoyl-ACP reductase [Candidatus Hydrogenedentota bacterium]